MNDCTDPVPVEYQCGFCRRPGVAYYERTCPPLHLETWQRMLACDLCADYHAGLRRLSDSIAGSCYSLSVLLRSPAEDVRREALANATGRLTPRTQALARHVCAHWEFPVQWEQEFVALLTERPERCRDVLADYVRRIRLGAETIRRNRPMSQELI